MLNDDTDNEVRTRLEEIELANAGVLTPEAVVQDAKSKASPLHSHFTWDVKKAAQKCWLEEARTLIRTVRVKVVMETIVIRAPYYVRDPTAKDGAQGYVSVKTLRTDADRGREALCNEFARVRDVLNRAKDLAAALGAAEDVDRLLDQVVDLRRRFDAPPAQATQRVGWTRSGGAGNRRHGSARLGPERRGRD